jgi:hypothetical protein
LTVHLGSISPGSPDDTESSLLGKALTGALEQGRRWGYCARLADNETDAMTYRAAATGICLAAAMSLTTVPVRALDTTAVKAAEEAAVGVMHAFMNAFNARDTAAWADTLHFPHVRLASGDVHMYRDRAAFLSAMDMDAFAAAFGWDHSTWDDMRIVQSSPEKVHVAVVFSRFDATGGKLASYHSLYVIELIDGRWGVRARSSFAP